MKRRNRNVDVAYISSAIFCSMYFVSILAYWICMGVTEYCKAIVEFIWLF